MNFLKVLVDDYEKNQYSHELIKNLDYCNTLKDNLKEFCHTIAFALKSDGTTHLHQRRRSKKTKTALEYHLLETLFELTSINDFHELKERVHIKGIGDLTAYDTAQQIGYTIGVYPKKVYIHRGAKVGLKNLRGPKKVRGRNYVEMHELPEELHALEPRDIENFLCIYKDDIAAGKLIRSRASCNGKKQTNKKKNC